MLIRYDDGSRELEIEARAEELQNLSQKLLMGGAVIRCDSQGADPIPYARFLTSIQIGVVPDDSVKFQVQSDVLLISGDKERLSVLAEEVLGFGTICAEGEHMHIEYYDSHFYLSPDSLPLVITCASH